MDIRYACKEDIDKIKSIWNYCFKDEESYEKYYFNNKYRSYNTIVVEEDDEILSSLQLNQYTLNLDKKHFDVSYVVGVSTLPQARGRGFMKDLMEFTLNEIYSRGQIVSILMPIDYRLYRKYGYEHCYDQLQYNIDIEDLKGFKAPGTMYKATNENIESLIKINKNFLHNKNGAVIRDKIYFENAFKEVKSEGGHIYIHKNIEDICDGYITYFLMEQTMFVKELYYENMNALKCMLGFIYNHNTQAKKVTINAPIEDKLKLILSNPNTCEIKLKPFMMGRVINVEEFIKQLDYDRDYNLSMVLKITDNQIDENNKNFKIILNKNIIDVDVTSEPEDISININAFSQIAFSYLTFDECKFIYDINIKEKNEQNVNLIFNLLFNKKENYINEYV